MLTSLLYKDGGLQIVLLYWIMYISKLLLSSKEMVDEWWSIFCLETTSFRHQNHNY